MANEAHQLQTPKDEAPDTVTPDTGGEQLPVVELRPKDNKLDVGADPLPKENVVDHIAEKRAKIQASAREARRKTDLPFSGDAHDPDVLYGRDADKDDLGEIEREAIARQKEVREAREAEEPRDEQEERPAPQRPLNGLDPALLATKVRTKIDGQEAEITVEDAIRNYQIQSAANARLEQANQLLSQAKSFHRNAAQPHVSEEENYQPDSQRQDESPPALDFKTMAEKIRLGTDEEAAETLQELIQMAQQNNAPVDTTETVLEVLEDRNSEAQLRDYAKKNPDLTDPIMQQIVIQNVHRAMADDLVAAGIPVEDLRQIINSSKDLTDMHKRARINRAPVRDTATLLSVAHAAAKAWRSGGQQPAPAKPAPAPALDRQGRKESLAPQPAMRRQASLADNKPAPSIEAIRANAVAKIRQGRHQST